MNTYEAVLIFRPEEEFVTSGREYLKELLNQNGCKLIKEEEMGNRELAYEIKKNTRGYYLYCEFESDPAKIQDLDRSLKLRGEVLKYLFFRKEDQT